MAIRGSGVLKTRLVALDKQLRPKSERVAIARERATRLINELHGGKAWMYSVQDFFPNGSLSRGTGLRGFDDVDYIVILNKRASDDSR